MWKQKTTVQQDSNVSCLFAKKGNRIKNKNKNICCDNANRTQGLATR